MAKKIEDPKTLAAKIAKTKAMAGDREVTVNKTPSAGFPGSGRPIMMEGVKIVAQAPAKPKEEPKSKLGYYVAVSNFGKNAGASKYSLDEVIRVAKKYKMNDIVGTINSFKESNRQPVLSSDQAATMRQLIKKENIPVYDEKPKTKSEAISIFKTGKTN